MKLRTIATIALVALLVTTGAAAATPGDASDDVGADGSDHGPSDAGDSSSADAAGSDHGPDDAEPDGNASENATAAIDQASTGAEALGDEDASAAAGVASSAGDAGPPEEMPGPVPDHVTQIHDTIRQFLNGGIDGSLGKAISGIL